MHKTPAGTCSSVPLPDSDYLRTVSESASDRTYFHSKPPHSYTGRLHLDEDVPHGRHNDNTYAVVEWFRSQYNQILKEDFGRDGDGNA